MALLGARCAGEGAAPAPEPPDDRGADPGPTTPRGPGGAGRADGPGTPPPDGGGAGGGGGGGFEADASPPRDAGDRAPADGSRADGSASDLRPANAAPDAPPGYKPSIVAVGYGGVRILSKDLGLTWGDRSAVEDAMYGNESNLLRAVTYAAGQYVAVGQLIFTSPDGVTWTPRVNTMRNWLGGIVFGNGLFMGGGGCGWTIRSPDGATWTRATSVTNQNCPTGSHRRSAAFGNGQIALAGDDRMVYVSTDTTKWTVLPGLSTSQVAFCNGAFRDRAACPSPGSGHGIYLRARANNIDRSVDGVTWRTVHRDTNVFQAFAFGFSP